MALPAVFPNVGRWPSLPSFGNRSQAGRQNAKTRHMGGMSGKRQAKENPPHGRVRSSFDKEPQEEETDKQAAYAIKP